MSYECFDVSTKEDTAHVVLNRPEKRNNMKGEEILEKLRRHNENVNYSYGEGACEVAERLNKKEYMGIFMCGSTFNDHEVNLVSDAIRKVYSNIAELK